MSSDLITAGTIVSSTISGATFGDGESLNGSFVATYDSSGVLTSLSDVSLTVTDQYGDETFIGAVVTASQPGSPYQIQLVADRSNFDYGSDHYNYAGGTFPAASLSTIGWSGQNPASLDPSTTTLYDYSQADQTQDNATGLTNHGAITNTLGYTPGYTGVIGTPSPANIESGQTLIVLSDQQQIVALTTDTSVEYIGLPVQGPFNESNNSILVEGLKGGDSIIVNSVDVFGYGDTGITQSYSYDNGVGFYTVTDGSGKGVEIAETGIPPNDASLSMDSNGNYILTDTAPCFRRGTAIRTAAGDVPVESLTEGDLVTLADGTSSPVVWLGHRTLDCGRHPNPRSVWPILVREGAFGEKMPARDLYLSPGHSVFVEGVLMQAEKLLNGATILQIETDTVEYWHVELGNHAILLAENLPAESYLDQGNRTAFINGGDFVEAHPDFQPKHWAETCAKLVFEGPEMQAAKASLLARAAALGHQITQEDDVHVIADGKRIDPVELGGSRIAFMLPAGSGKISLHSRSFVPAHASPGSRDKRSLGIRIRGMQLDGADLALDDETAFGAGWHKHERKDGTPGARWTSGPAPIPANTRLIMIERAGTGTYWAPETATNVVALFG